MTVFYQHNTSEESVAILFSSQISTTLSISSGITFDTTFLGITENVSRNLSEDELLLQALGPKRRDLTSVIFLLIIYSVIFITGTLGNVCTCIVIVKNHYMQTTTNFYLFSLAISDILILLRLPHECYTVLESYPWRAGEVFCVFQALLTEVTSYASILTITAFTVERYIAICHPLISHKITDFKRTIKIIIVIWILSFMFAMPYPIFTETFYYIDNPIIEDSLICNIGRKWTHLMKIVFQVSTFLFFVFPMTLITLLYIRIAIALRRASLNRAGSEESQGNHSCSHSRKVVLRMLVAVVVAFFICWAPFHAQRLFTMYNTDWSKNNLEIQSHMFYISGVLYFVGSTVNPVLYNVMSKRYRQAFKETLCCCCFHRSLGNQGSLLLYYSYIKNPKKRKSSKLVNADWRKAEGSSVSNHHHRSSDIIGGDGHNDSLRKSLLDICKHDKITNNGSYSVGNGVTYHPCPTCSTHVTNGNITRDTIVKMSTPNKVEILDSSTRSNIYPMEKIKAMEQEGSRV